MYMEVYASYLVGSSITAFLGKVAYSYLYPEPECTTEEVKDVEYSLVDTNLNERQVKSDKDITHIQSLVVYPNYFRQGIGTKLVQYVIDTYDTKVFTVETGVDNYPAIKLYKNFAFLEQSQWDTDHGIRKIRLKRIV